MTDEVVEFRLSAIEKGITELRDVVIENKLQRNDIDRIDIQVQQNTDDIAVLKAQPIKDKALKWQTTLDLIYKLVLTAAVGVVLVKIGLGG